MKKFIIALTILTAFTACQKEPSFENPDGSSGGSGGGGSSTGTKLVRVGTRAGTDTITTNYTYNSANFLIRFSQSGTIGGMPITVEVRYVRNAANIITSSIVKSTDIFAQFGVDSVQIFHVYDAANSRYKYSISPVVSVGGGTMQTDSTVYNYTSGKIATIISYNNDGSGYVPESKADYVYTGSNLTVEKLYSYDSGNFTYNLDEVDNYEYDAKTNPTQFAADAAVMSLNLFYSANNEAKRTVVQTGSPAVVVTTAYTYNSNNRPLTAITTSGGTVTSTSSYVYQ